MENLLMIIFSFLVAGIFVVPVRFKYILALLPVLIVIGYSSIISFNTLGLPLNEIYNGALSLFGFPGISIVIDKISAFFILTVNFTVLTGMLYARVYLKAYHQNKLPVLISWHYLNLILLHISMLLVCMLRDAFPFLVAWELMTVSSFILVIFEAEQRKNLKTGINYLLQMHIGMFFILSAFLLASNNDGQTGFDVLPEYFSSHSALPVFLLFFTGFGIKAGFIPFHTWLPDAHPAAPSHVSGIMSGVMIKMGIYGIVRVLMTVKSGMFDIGIFLLIISLLTGIYGVLQAIVQHDLKKLLAYHSIENIGIIGIGLGLGCIGMSMNNYTLAALGFGGGLLHVLNHSLFKSLLFYTSGSIYHATHTRDINQLGGLINKMPITAWFFLLGSLAISGLPPFNGFISEFLIYYGMFSNIPGAGFYFSILLLISILGLTLIGGLAIFCFTKAFSVTFLGEARSNKIFSAKESSRFVLFPFILIGLLIVFTGIAPVFIFPLIKSVVCGSFSINILATDAIVIYDSLVSIGFISSLLIIIILFLLLLRYIVLRRRKTVIGPTWGCGYSAGSPKMQYTASSFSDNVARLAGVVVNVRKETEAIGEKEIFPEKRSFVSHASELMETWFIDRPVLFLRKAMRGIAFLQTGQIHHYILYPFVYILIILILSLLKLL